MSQTKPPPLATADEVAEALSLSPSAIYRMAERGEIPCFRFGRTVRFDLDEVRQSGRLHVGGVQENPDVRNQKRRSMVRDLQVQAPHDGKEHTIPPYHGSWDDEA